MTKNCLNCHYCDSWYIPQTYWEPGESGWECKLHLDEEKDYPDDLPFDDEHIGAFYAEDCSHYVKDPNKNKHQQ